MNERLADVLRKSSEAKRHGLDHVVALSKGGEHRASNLVPACKRCNSRKGTRSTYYA